jgi:tetratricopeptide (TPR) repeat protein
MRLGELKAAERSLRRTIDLCRKANDKSGEAIAHQKLGKLLVCYGAFDEAEKEFDSGIKLHTNTLDGQWWQGTSWLYRAQNQLLQRNVSQAIKSAMEAKRLKDIEYPGVGKVERDIIQAEWLLGAALTMEGKDLNAAASHLTEALTRCRRINLVELEPDILLAWARWHRVRGSAQEARAHADEALAIADRCEYRLKQAEIHNFLARAALDAGDGEAARRHAETARERAWCDGPPHCYKSALDEAEQTLGELGVKNKSR